MLFSKQTDLVQVSEQEFIKMLHIGYDMFSVAIHPIAENQTNVSGDDLKAMDKKINKMHRDVRKKLFEHLSLSGGKDLFPSLVLLSVIDDSERIGDYIKNTADLLSKNGTLEIDDFQNDFMKILTETDHSFSATIQAFVDDNETAAEELVANYKIQAKRCEDLLTQLFKTKNTIKKDYIALALLVRYLKRICAHLKNIASAVVNPYHRIGYKVKK